MGVNQILCCGLSPTVQRTIFYDAPVKPGTVARAKSVVTTASGKAVNVARMVAQLGGNSRLVHPLAGETGRLVERLLTEDGVSQSVSWLLSGLTRTCTTVIDGETTELVEEAPPLSPDDLREIERHLETQLASSALLCLSGSFPMGVPVDWYARWVASARELGIPTLVDAQKEPLRACLPERPWLVKPNRTEAIATLGLAGDATATDAALGLRDAGAVHALVSDGPCGAVFAGPEGLIRIVPPALKMVNPIGSGDALAAGIATHAVNHGGNWQDTLRAGFASAAANCMTPTSGVVHPPTYTQMLPLIDVAPALEQGA